MRLKPMLAAMLFAAVAPVLSYATIEESDLVLGGLTLGESLKDVVAIYGDPDSLTVPAMNYCDGNMVYGVTFSVAYDVSKEDPSDGEIVDISTSGANGVATSKGIRVGSSEADVIAAYGQPDRMDGAGNGWYAYYTGSNPRRDSHLMLFMSNGVVKRILVGFGTGE